jgi:hypothetical protein
LRHGASEETSGEHRGVDNTPDHNYRKTADMTDARNAQPEDAEGMVTSRWRRWIVSIGLAITALPLLALLVLYLLNPAGTRLVVGMLLHPLVANTRPPAMFADQLTAARVIDRAETSRQLTARLQHEFPIGTTEATLKAALLGRRASSRKPPARLRAAGAEWPAAPHGPPGGCLSAAGPQEEPDI